MTQPTKPSAGAIRAQEAIRKLLASAYLYPEHDDFDGTVAKIIDRETGVAGLLEAAKEALIVLDELVDEVEDMQEYKLQRPIEERLRQAISKCEGKGSE